MHGLDARKGLVGPDPMGEQRQGIAQGRSQRGSGRSVFEAEPQAIIPEMELKNRLAAPERFTVWQSYRQFRIGPRISEDAARIFCELMYPQEGAQHPIEQLDGRAKRSEVDALPGKRTNTTGGSATRQGAPATSLQGTDRSFHRPLLGTSTQKGSSVRRRFGRTPSPQRTSDDDKFRNFCQAQGGGVLLLGRALERRPHAPKFPETGMLDYASSSCEGRRGSPELLSRGKRRDG